MPNTSCDRPGSSDGPPSNASLFGLAPGGVYLASPVTRGTGALLPHLFTLTPRDTHGRYLTERYLFCGTFLRVTTTPCYGAPCPLELGLSSRVRQDASDRLACSDIGTKRPEISIRPPRSFPAAMVESSREKMLKSWTTPPIAKRGRIRIQIVIYYTPLTHVTQETLSV